MRTNNGILLKYELTLKGDPPSSLQDPPSESARLKSALTASSSASAADAALNMTSSGPRSNGVSRDKSRSEYATVGEPSGDPRTGRTERTAAGEPEADESDDDVDSSSLDMWREEMWTGRLLTHNLNWK